MASKVMQRRLLEPVLANSSANVCLSCRFASLAIASPSRRYSSTVGKMRQEPGAKPNLHLGKYQQAPGYMMRQTKKEREAEAAEPKKERRRRVAKIDTEAAADAGRGLPSEQNVFEEETLKEEEQDGEEYEDYEGDVVAKPAHEEIEPEALQNVLDPEPGKTMAWRRKKLIQSIRNRGYLTKAQQIARTERQIQVSSAMFKTSTKKLMHLARQIAGKPIDEAIVQMQLSKKKTGMDIMRHLEYAKNLAVVSRGMGLGRVEGREGEPVEIELQDGKRKLVKDRTGIYVEQAWVNKGSETMTPEYRGRGRVFRLTHCMAKITVILKEEATRIRLSQEKQEKILNRKLWLHLPDRPITLQRQYPLW